MKDSPAATRCAHSRWKKLYLAALFENDKSKLARKIADAQVAIVAQRKDSLMSDTKERQLLDTAMLCLQALANCSAITPSLIGEIRAASPSDVRAA